MCRAVNPFTLLCGLSHLRVPIMFHRKDDPIPLRDGDQVRIRSKARTPYAGRLGVVRAVEPTDAHGPYLVEFDDGMQFRYELQELERLLTRLPS